MSSGQDRRRKCKNPTNSFCFICGDFIKARSVKRPLSVKIQEAYYCYFGIRVTHQDKSWAPHVICTNCNTNLTGWYRGEKKRNLKFTVPRIWREPTSHETDCYFCLAKPVRGKKPGSMMVKNLYLNLPSSSAPVPRSSSQAAPKHPAGAPETSSASSSDDENDDPESSEDKRDPDYHSTVRYPRGLSNTDFNDLVKELKLTPGKIRIFKSELRQRNILRDDAGEPTRRTRHSLRPLTRNKAGF
ncbi:hypothetical protein DMENIID0001_061420 [Sergentomyia squamirostris]